MTSRLYTIITGLIVTGVLAILPPTAQAQLGESTTPALSDTAGTPTGAPIPDLGPIEIRVEDYPSDDGEALIISWDDPGYSSLSDFLEYRVIKYLPESDSQAVVGTSVIEPEIMDGNASDEIAYEYRVAAVFPDTAVYSAVSDPMTAEVEWYFREKLAVILIGIFVCAAVIFFIETAKRGKTLFLRKIAGLEAIDEAVGRATEMGRPILFVAGIQDMDDVQTLAGLTLLGRVARTVAQYDSKINMPCRASLVMTAGREVIKQAYNVAGRPDAYSDDMVHYVTDEQFGFVAAVNGIMVREKPATCFYLGAFFAESLILAETGNSIEAIQIAGTAMPAQLPFFVAACDYTLIGEELFAASAYLSEEPRQLGSLKGQDIGKALAMIAIVVGGISMTLAQAWDLGVFEWLSRQMDTIFSIQLPVR